MSLRMITAPPTPEVLAETLAEATAQRRAVTPWGAGRHQHLGLPPSDDAFPLSTVGLARILEYAPADLTMTLEAGARLADVQALLSANGQWLPWDPPGGRAATIGGLLAAGRSGPLRLGYGTPRDWLLGAHVALGDGRLVKSGGKVVKNVAGYDAHKLHLGALGTLGVLISVTLKLAPLPERSATLAFTSPSHDVLFEAAELLRRPPLAPTSLAIVGAPAAKRLLTSVPNQQSMILARYVGVERAVERQLREARANLAGISSQSDLVLYDIEAGDRTSLAVVWERISEYAMPVGTELVLRIGVRPPALGSALTLLSQQLPPETELLGYPGVGLAYARWFPDAADHGTLAHTLAELRRVLAPHEGYLVVEAAPPALRTTLDLWGPPPLTLPIMQRLKAQWDPAGILNPGRYLPGL